MYIPRKYYNSIDAHTCLGKWWLYLLFFPSLLFSQFHVIGYTKITINSDVIVSKSDSLLIHGMAERKEKAKIYVVEGTKIHGFEQTTSNEITYVKSESKPKVEHKNRQVLAKKENSVKESSKNPNEVTGRKPDSFKIAPISIPSGSFSSVYLSQEAILPLIKRSKTNLTGELFFYEIYKIVLPEDFYISGYFPHAVFCNLMYCGKKWASRPPPTPV